MRLTIKSDEIYLLPIPSNMVNIIYSNQDGGNEGIKYRYLEWLSDIIKKNEEQPNEIYLTLKDTYEKIKNYLLVNTPNFYLENFNFV
jgi:hypothetical protein